jgi:hypothetical protein
MSLPNGIKALADYVHNKGLKLGIYTEVGTLTCEKRPGSLNHELQDARTYASWGVDYVKVGWCNSQGLDPEVQYAKTERSKVLRQQTTKINEENANLCEAAREKCVWASGAGTPPPEITGNKRQVGRSHRGLKVQL